MNAALLLAALTAADVELTLADAVAQALRNLPEVEIERTAVREAGAGERAARGFFDPRLRAGAGFQDATTPTSNPFESLTGRLTQRTRNQQVSLLQNLPFWGARFEAGWQNQHLVTSNPFFTLNPLSSPRLTGTLTIPLWRDRALDAARAEIRIRRAVRKSSEAQLTATVIETAGRVERAYGELAAAQEALQRQSELVRLARETLEATQRQAAAGQLPDADVAGARARAAQAEEGLRQAEGAAAMAEFALKELVAASPRDSLWSDRLRLRDREPLLLVTPVPELIERALVRRVELTLAAARLEPARVEQQLAAEQRKPAVNLELGAASQGLAGREIIFPGGLFGFDARVPATLVGGAGQALSQAAAFRYPTWTAGLNVELPLGQRAASGRMQQTALAVRKLELEQERLRRQIVREVHQAAALRDAARDRQQLATTGVEQARQRLDSELRLLAEGKSNNLNLNVRQAELAEAEQRWIQARREWWAAVAELRRASAHTLEDFNLRVE